MNRFAHLETALRTHVGRKRGNNEDCALLLSEHGLFAVADGMGGGDDGEFASAAAVDRIEAAFAPYHERLRPLDSEAKAFLVRTAANQACRDIRSRMHEQGTSGTGTTLVVLMFDPARVDQVLALHAGDSRVYRFRDGALRAVTRDHSVGAAVGIESEDDLPVMFRGVVTRAVGIADQIEMEPTDLDVAADDILLLCTDGLYRMVPDDELRERLRTLQAEPAEGIAAALVDAALEAGGADNITVAVIRVGALPEPVTAENPLFDAGADGSKTPPPAPTTVTNDPLSPGATEGDSGRSGSSGDGLPDDQDCIEADAAPLSPGVSETAPDAPTRDDGSNFGDAAHTETADRGPETATARDGVPDLRTHGPEASPDRTGPQDVAAPAAKRPGGNLREWFDFNRPRVLLAIVAAAVLLVVLGVWIGRSNARRPPAPVASGPPAAVPVPERAPEVGWVRVERGPAHAERPVVLWRRDPETGGLTEIPGERLELERGVYAFRWERDGFERQDVEITVTPGDVFVLRPAPWIERAP